MARRKLFLLTTMAIALSGSNLALADRLGGAYRGPEEVQATAKDTSTTSGGETTGPEGTAKGNESSGSTGVGEGGGSSGGGESSGGGGSEPGGSGGESGGSSGGTGGNDVGAGGAKDKGGGSGGKAEASGGGGGAGGGSARGKGGDSAAEAQQVVSWYFEHNRERLVREIVVARGQRVRPQKGSVAAALSLVPRDARLRSPVTAADREKIVDVLKKNTRAMEDIVRDAAVIGLGKIGTPDAVAHLRERLAEESKWDIREDILLALGIARSPESTDALLAVLAAPSPSLNGRFHVYALMGLGLTQDPEKVGPAVLEYFNQTAKSGKPSEELLAAASMALGTIGYEPSVPALAASLKARNVSDLAKSYVLQALGRIGGDEARKAIDSQCDSKNIDTARSALLALGSFPDLTVAKTLAGKEGLGRPDPLGAGFAAISLARVLNARPEGDLKKVTEDLRDVAMSPEKGSIKAQYANLALGMFDGGLDGEARRVYADNFKNSAKVNADVLSSMAISCGVGTVSGMESSMRAIADSSGADPKLRGYAAFALGMTGASGPTADALRSIFQSSDNPDVQRGAVLGMGLVGDRDDVPFLLDVIVKTDRSKPFAAYTRGAAVAALGIIRDGDSIPKVQELLRNTDPWVRAYAVATLAYMADKDYAPVLPSLFEHGNFRHEFPALKIIMRTL